MSSTSGQPWPISQSLQKAKGICSVCHEVRQLHNRDGLVHRHGPRNNPCPGSHREPDSVLPDSVDQRESADHFTGPDSNQIAHQKEDNAESATDSALLSHPRVPGRLMKHIPASARPCVSQALSKLLDDIVTNPDNCSLWSKLLYFGASILPVPKRGGKRQNLATRIKKNVTIFSETLLSDVVKFTVEKTSDNYETSRRNCSRDEKTAAAVSAKLEEGNIRAAVRILCSEEEPVLPDRERLKELIRKHPEPQVNELLPPQQRTQAAFQASQNDVLKAIRSFPPGSAGGPDGIRPQHILSLVKCRETGETLLSSMTSFVNLLLKGTCPETVSSVLFGGTLMALQKKSGGLRPIAIGYYWRRLSSKCANTYAIRQLCNFFAPKQLGVGIPGGCEAAAHSARRFVEQMHDDEVLVKLDFANAFNSLSRAAMLKAVASHIPDIYPYCHLAYGKASHLQFGEFSISSQRGAQQGDPLGPLLFCLPLQELLLNLKSPLVIGYLDDVSLGGASTVVANDIAILKDEANTIGLSLNAGKCEVMSKSATALPQPLDIFIFTNPDDACLLGAPLSTGTALTNALEANISKLSVGFSRMPLLDSQEALIILRSSMGFQRTLFTLRAAPCMHHPLLEKFDNMLRECLSSVLNISLSDSQWIQASLPIRHGGFGIRRVSPLALPAFLASAAGTASLQSAILQSTPLAEDEHLSSATADWCSITSLQTPNIDKQRHQSQWDNPLIAKELSSLFSSNTSEADRARLNAVTSQHSGDWLFALPISNCGLRLDNEAVRVAAGLRLGTTLCMPHSCPCGAQVERDGHHGLSCRLGPGRIARHAALNDILCRSLIKAGFPSSKEPSGLSRSDGMRPDGCTLIPWRTGKCVIWDVTVADTFAASYCHQTAAIAGAAAERAADRKRDKYQQLTGSYRFVPLAMETMGPINEEGLHFLQEIGRILTRQSGDERETSFLLQRISVTLQRFNAVAFRGTFTAT